MESTELYNRDRGQKFSNDRDSWIPPNRGYNIYGDSNLNEWRYIS